MIAEFPSNRFAVWKDPVIETLRRHGAAGMLVQEFQEMLVIQVAVAVAQLEGALAAVFRFPLDVFDVERQLRRSLGWFRICDLALGPLDGHSQLLVCSVLGVEPD